MESGGLLEESKIFQYSLLSMKVSQHLIKLRKGEDLTEQEYAALRRGAALLKDIIEGSMLMAGKGTMSGFSPSFDGLSAYSHALSAIDKLKMSNKNEEFTQLFLQMYQDLVTIIVEKKPKTDMLETLIQFFNMISKLFSADILKDNFYRTTEPFESRRSQRV